MADGVDAPSVAVGGGADGGRGPLDAGPMGQEELARMRAYGRALYRRNTGFSWFVRGR